MQGDVLDYRSRLWVVGNRKGRWRIARHWHCHTCEDTRHRTHTLVWSVSTHGFRVGWWHGLDTATLGQLGEWRSRRNSIHDQHSRPWRGSWCRVSYRRYGKVRKDRAGGGMNNSRWKINRQTSVSRCTVRTNWPWISPHTVTGHLTGCTLDSSIRISRVWTSLDQLLMINGGLTDLVTKSFYICFRQLLTLT